MYEWFIFLRGLSFGVILALVLAVLILHRQHYAMRIIALFGLSVSGYVLAPLLYEKSSFFYLCVLVADTGPLMFLLFTQAVFEEHGTPAKASLWVGAGYLTAGYAASYLPAFMNLPESITGPLWYASRVIMASLLAYALYVTLRQWREDLVAPRRTLRLTVIAIVGGYVLGVVVVESVMGAGAAPLWVEVANSMGIAISTLLFASALVFLGPQELSGNSAVPIPTKPQATVDQREVDKILSAMESEHIFRDMELTISSLGAALSIPEHRLRLHINQQLAYRNFNDFLNHYRIVEASARLRDPDRARIPVLTIAMDAGYRSMTTFNKAFKATHGQTPVEYRQKHLPIS